MRTDALPRDPRWRARRALDRLAFGPRPGQVDAVAAEGPEAWIRARLAAPGRTPAPPDWEDWIPGDAMGRPRDEDDLQRMRRAHRRAAVALASARLRAAVSGEAPLHLAMVDFLGNHFAISAKKPSVAGFLPSWEYEVLHPGALGSFPDLLAATARHPAMLLYLDNWRSAGEGASASSASRRRRRTPEGLNENYARELLELHTLGVHGGYTQEDVEQVARAFTGWTLGPQGVGRRSPRAMAAWLRAGRPVDFAFEPGWHDAGSKRVLGRTLPPGRGVEDGEEILARLALHPATADHLARKLAVRFLSDDPPPAAVERAARAFRRSGGDLRATLEALLLGGPELFDPALRKVKTPFELVVSALRATGDAGDRPLAGLAALRRLGHVPYLPPSPAGYADVAGRWIDPGAILERSRFAFALARASGPGRGDGPSDAPSPRTIPAEPRALDGRLAEPGSRDGLLAEPVGPGTRAVLRDPRLGETERLALALASPEFQLR